MRRAILGLALLLCCPSAAGAASWSAPRSLTAPGAEAAESPAVAINRSGEIVVAWIARTPSASAVVAAVGTRRRLGTPRVVMRTHHHGPGDRRTDIAGPPVVAIEDDGRAVVVAGQTFVGPNGVERSYLAGGFGSARPFTPTTGWQAVQPAVVLDNSGRVVAAWSARCVEGPCRGEPFSIRFAEGRTTSAPPRP